ncbi:DUF2935 domain-containing protein [Effusibacillus pohliae]|uniref:DUF2935 domain-containing protein n=1 Tax=Effusibacillus pohliae TaxID=232270 RepID=UPI00035D089B|nr:DUF2935 domain-containing protein [Effusibacillus pohliae]
MSRTDSREQALFEHRFWLQILGDHARFILNSLSPKEIEEIRRANQLMHTFDSLLTQARRPLTAPELAELNGQAHRFTEQIREFKLHLLRRHLQGTISINLPPTLLNHMLNELSEYLTILHCLLAGEAPPLLHPVHHHLVWLPDAAGHAATISDATDMAEKRIIEQSDRFTKHFEQFYLKAVEVAGYLRSGLDRFPALARFNRETELEIKLFIHFLREIEEMRLTDELLGTISPLMADHMAREECYYLIKLAQVSELTPPGAHPPRGNKNV